MHGAGERLPSPSGHSDQIVDAQQPDSPAVAAAAAPSAPAPLMEVVITKEDVRQAGQDLKQQGASLLQRVHAAREGVRQKGETVMRHGGEVLQQGTAAAQAARQHGAELYEAAQGGVEAAQDHLQQGVALWQQGAEVVHSQYQHGAEGLHRGVEHVSEAWRRAAPYLDQAILATNVSGVMTIVGFFFVGLTLVFSPLTAEHGAFDRMFWLIQGLYLVVFSVPALVATLQCGVLRSGFERWPAWMQVDLWLGVLKFQLGRAIFYVAAGFYVFPLMRNFSNVANIEMWIVILSYILGITSLLSGIFLLLFDVILAVYVRQAIHRPVPQSPSAAE